MQRGTALHQTSLTCSTAAGAGRAGGLACTQALGASDAACMHSRVRTDAAPYKPEGQQRPEGPGRPVGPGRLAGPYWGRPSGVRALWLCWWGRRR